ncbi:MAG: MarR family transcriptional regulator [Capsulimonadaceae bacterium]|nr:MarR family transcriptional regulator [Capsulimonadaceae bacterium]
MIDSEDPSVADERRSSEGDIRPGSGERIDAVTEDGVPAPTENRPQGLLSRVAKVLDPRMRLISEFMILLHETHTLLTAEENEWLATYGLSVTKMHFLLLLRWAPDNRMSMSELSKDMIVTGGSITKLVDAMEVQGLVKRTSMPGDRRVVLIELTEQGSTVFDRVSVLHDRFWEETWAAVTDEDFAILSRQLAEVKRVCSTPRVH